MNGSGVERAVSTVNELQDIRNKKKKKKEERKKNISPAGQTKLILKINGNH